MDKKITKAVLVAFLRAKLGSDPNWAKAALLRIFDNQTESEKVIEDTTNCNGVGFTVGDAKLLTKFAIFYKERGFLSPKQMKWVFAKMSKYAGQLVKESYFSWEKLEICYRKSIAV